MDMIGYCTNVHAGNTLEEVKQNLETYSVPVRDRIAGDGELGVGLWLSNAVVQELVTETQVKEFGEWLQERRLCPYTFNGFPFGDFHEASVKKKVYQPTWAEPQRLSYTKRLAEIQSVIYAGQTATISTLPIGWPNQDDLQSVKQESGKNLVRLANELHEIYENTGRHITVCLEPEPGCIFDTAPGLVTFFEEFVLRELSHDIESHVRKYLGVCHDVCHSAVMFEQQKDAIDAYAAAGIEVAKVQISSAIEAEFSSLESADRQTLRDRLASFCEPRYLHQTSVQIDNKVTFYDDLPIALDANEPEGLWRVHFHVPIFKDEFGLIRSTQTGIKELLAALNSHSMSPQLEVETYAWNVMPDEYQDEALPISISREIEWLNNELKRG